jgi:hypothetical protein
MPDETSEDHFVSMKRSSGATDSVRSETSGRNEVVLWRRQAMEEPRAGELEGAEPGAE